MNELSGTSLSTASNCCDWMLAGNGLARASFSRIKPALRYFFLSADGRFHLLLLVLASSVMAIIMVIFGYFISGSSQSIFHSGIDFLLGWRWDPAKDIYGAFPFIAGTLYTSAIAIIIGVPISVGVAIFLSEMCPRWLRTPLDFVVELLAAVPSVIFGFWGIFTLRGILRDSIEPALISNLGFLPIFEGRPFGLDKLSAGLILAIMIIPTVSAISREVLRAVPDSQKEAALALGANKYEMISTAVLSYAKSGIFGAGILGLGRAIGETMAVTMVIGNSNTFSWSMLDPGQTMASLIASNWWEADGGTLYQSALIEIGLVLFIVMLIVNIVGRVFVGKLLGLKEGVVG
ncbi:MAG: phosphate ABC transporter permease subunit PstC [Thermoplasmata archaeon]